MTPRLAFLWASLLAFSGPSYGFSPLFTRLPSARAAQGPFTSSPCTKGVNGVRSGPSGLSSLMRRSAAISLDAPLQPAEADEKLPKRIPFGQRIKIGKYIVTPAGLFMLVSVFGWASIVFGPFCIAYLFCLLFDAKRRRILDWATHWWSLATMKTVGYKPTVIGVENLPPVDEPVIYVPNHTSYLDILTMSGFVPRPFKYISKIEILRIPIIGWSMRMGAHIAIRRASLESQRKMVEDAIKHLKNGVSLVTFAEGTRSKDGKLQQFKKGAFRIAKEVGVRIVPVSICHLNKWMPADAVLPVGIPNDVVLKIHPPIETKGRNENVVMREVFAAVNEGLPAYQQFPEKPAAVDSSQ